MNTTIRSNSVALSFALSLIGFAFVFSPARAATIFDITFPIAELGGCADRDACKAYCADETNRAACEEFAANHGLAEHGDARASAALKDGGPGACARGARDPQKACHAYCDSANHIQECVAYGKSHGLLTGDQLAEAEKVAHALAGGAALPEGCTSASACREACENPSSLAQAKSCFAFAKTAGLLPPDFDEARAEKIFQAIQDGTAPFKTPQEFRKCEHPEDADTLAKCVDFGVKSGMLTDEQARVIKKTGGKGPGGCVGENECKQYCSEHQDACFQFAKDNGLITPEQEAQMKQGVEQFRRGLEHAPPAVRTCISSVLGADKLSALLKGDASPDSAMGEKLRSCFEAQQSMEGNTGQNEEEQNATEEGDQQNAHESDGAFGAEDMNAPTHHVPPFPLPPQHGALPDAVKTCLRQKYGDDFVQKISQGPVAEEDARALAECFKNSFGMPSRANAPEGLMPLQGASGTPSQSFGSFENASTSFSPPSVSKDASVSPASLAPPPVSLRAFFAHPISALASVLSALMQTR